MKEKTPSPSSKTQTIAEKSDSSSHPPSSPHSSRLPLIFGGVLILALGFLGGWYYGRSSTPVENIEAQVTPTIVETVLMEDEMAGWETYVNEEYGFEFQFPASYMSTINRDNQNSQKLLSIILKKVNPTPSGGYPQPHVEFVVYDNDTNDLESWMSKHTTNLPFDDETVSMPNSLFFYRGVTNKEKTTLAGKPAYSFQSYSLAASPNPTLTEVNGYIIGVVFDNENESKDPELKTLYPQILSTFEFVDESASVPADWEIYTNKNEGYIVGYPSNWYLNKASSIITSYNPDNPPGLPYVPPEELKVWIVSSENTQQLTLEQFVQKEQNESSDTTITAQEEVQVGGKKGILQKGYRTGGSKNNSLTEVYTSHNNFFYTIRAYPADSNHSATLFEMLESFQFINKQ